MKGDLGGKEKKWLVCVHIAESPEGDLHPSVFGWGVIKNKLVVEDWFYFCVLVGWLFSLQTFRGFLVVINKHQRITSSQSPPAELWKISELDLCTKSSPWVQQGGYSMGLHFMTICDTTGYSHHIILQYFMVIFPAVQDKLGYFGVLNGT